MRKGLAALVCLTMMSALWSWATTTLYVQIKTSNPGGSVTLFNVTAQSDTTSSVKYAATTVADPATVAADAVLGTAKVKSIDATKFKIVSITKNGAAVAVTSPTQVDVPLTKADFVDATKASGFRNPTVVATFADLNAGPGKSWQLQVRNNNAGGTISTKRATDATAATTATVGQLVLKNYKDTAPVTVTVAPITGYHVAKITVNGKEQSLAANGASTAVTVDPAATSAKVFTVAATYKQNALTVINNAALKSDGTAGQSVYRTSFGGSVTVMVAPTGTNNLVNSITVSGDAKASMTDSTGNTSAPFRGVVKVVLSEIKGDVTVGATYGLDPKPAIYSQCSATCHATASASVQAVYGQWDASKHSTKEVSCVTCHTTMPGGVVKASVDADTYKITAAGAGTIGTNYCSKCHAASVTVAESSTHYVRGKLACTNCHEAGHNPQFTAGACSVCHAVVNGHTAENMGTKSCIECHDKHNPATVTGSLGPATQHPAVKLYTFEEVGMQMAGGQRVPVQVDANGNGLPYSPKQTCGVSGCHVKNGVDYTYDKISDHAFHSNEGRSEYVDAADGKFDATKNKPWGQSTAMVGKW